MVNLNIDNSQLNSDWNDKAPIFEQRKSSSGKSFGKSDMDYAKSHNKWTWKKRFLIWGLLAIILGGFMYNFFDALLHQLLKYMIVIREGGIVFYFWKAFPIPVILKFRFFHIVNPAGALRGEKIRVVEKGPFVFEQWRRKEVVAWHEDGKIVEYLEFKTHYFRPEDSASLDEPITILNAPVVAMGPTVRDMLAARVAMMGDAVSPLVYGLLNAFLEAHDQNLFITKTPRQLFYGYRIYMLDTIKSLLKPLELMGVKDILPPEPVNNTFGFFYGKNNTPEGPWQVWTGIGDTAHMFNVIHRYKGKNTVDFWKTDECNKMIGTDGTFFPVDIYPGKKLFAFSPDVCRSIHLEYVKESSIYGIPTYQYTLPRSMLLGVDKFRENECYCTATKRDVCLIDGIYDMSGCQYGAPIELAAPHFLGGEPWLQKTVIGLNPDPALHATSVEFDRLTSQGLGGKSRMMFALRLEKMPNLRGFRGLRNISAHVPLVWAEQGAVLPDHYVSILKGVFFYPVWTLQYFWPVLTFIGTVAFIGGICVSLYDALTRCGTSQIHSGDNSEKPKELTKADADTEKVAALAKGSQRNLTVVNIQPRGELEEDLIDNYLDHNDNMTIKDLDAVSDDSIKVYETLEDDGESDVNELSVTRLSHSVASLRKASLHSRRSTDRFHVSSRAFANNQSRISPCFHTCSHEMQEGRSANSSGSSSKSNRKRNRSEVSGHSSTHVHYNNHADSISGSLSSIQRF